MNRSLCDKEWVSAGEAAAELGTTPLRVLMLVKSGELVGREGAGGWQVQRASLAERREVGAGRTLGASACGGCSGCGTGA